MNKFTKWVYAAGIRAIKTAAQTALSLLTIGQTFLEVDWVTVASIAGVAAVYSLITSLAGLPEIKEDTEEYEL